MDSRRRRRPPGAAPTFTGAPATGRLSVAPNNIANTISLAGAVNLPGRTRLSANVSYSLRTQDDTFLPHTNNPSLASPSLVLPSTNLDGVGLDIGWRPLEWLSFSVGYEYEFGETQQQSHSREQTGTRIFDFADFTWTSKNVSLSYQFD